MGRISTKKHFSLFICQSSIVSFRSSRSFALGFSPGSFLPLQCWLDAGYMGGARERRCATTSFSWDSVPRKKMENSSSTKYFVSFLCNTCCTALLLEMNNAPTPLPPPKRGGGGRIEDGHSGSSDRTNILSPLHKVKSNQNFKWTRLYDATIAADRSKQEYCGLRFHHADVESIDIAQCRIYCTIEGKKNVVE